MGREHDFLMTRGCHNRAQRINMLRTIHLSAFTSQTYRDCQNRDTDVRKREKVMNRDQKHNTSTEEMGATE